MKLHYYQDPHGNFGDDLNPWLWTRLVPELIDGDGRTLFLGIGTILRRDLPTSPGKVVFGSGAGYGRPPAIDQSWQIYCVRGPRTATALGLPADRAVTDPALLVRHALPLVPVGERASIAFVPHHESVHRAAAQGVSLRLCAEAAGLTYVDPGGDLDDVLRTLSRAEAVITEAMHGAILADAFRVPWIPVRMYSHVLKSKWLDWTESMEIPYEPIENAVARPDADDLIAMLVRVRSVTKHQALMSADVLLQSKLDRLSSLLDRLRADHASGRIVSGEAAAPAAPRAALPGGSPSWWHGIASAFSEIVRVVPPGESFALADDGQWEIDDPALASRVLRLHELGGSYAGPPTDAADVHRMFTRARDTGVRFIAIGWPSFWWLTAYEGSLLGEAG
jgi:succinoglycan biosynthesis protein ExoV